MSTRLLDAKPGDSLLAADAALYVAWRDAVMLSRASASATWTNFAAAFGGGYHRYGFAINVTKPGGGATRTVVLDTSMDWRDRVCLVRGMPGAGNSQDLSIFPGSGDDREFNNPFGTTASSSSLSRWRLWYSNAGIASDTATGNGQVEIPDSNTLLYARLSDGALCLDLRDGSPYAVLSTGIFVLASDQTGERVTPAYSVGGPAPANYDLVRPADLNWLQEHGTHDQFRADVDDPAGTIDSWPLGAVTQGDPPVPEEFVVRGRQHRQAPAGGAHRYHQGLHETGGSTTVDTSIDWRDRVVHITARWSTSDIRPGGAAEANHNDATLGQASFYTGPGGFVSGAPTYYQLLKADLYVMADASGALIIHNLTPDDLYLTMVLEATPPLGPRSK